MVTPQKIKPSKEQKAILASKKDTMVISNPGTGKTTTLAYKVLDLLDSGVDPTEILCITFTEKAKKEMLDKLFEMAKGKYSESVILKVNVSTFHGFANNYLINSGMITGEIVGNNLLRYCILESFIENKALNYPKDYIIGFLIGRVENAIRHMKSFGISHDAIDIKKTQQIIQQNYTPTPAFPKEDVKKFLEYFVDAYKFYESKKEKKIDYSDMMLMFLDKHQGEQYKHVLVDEMQDMNDLQAEIVEKISENLFLVGDSKQAIFGFQGGSIKNFQKFAQNCKTMFLSTNRRSTQQILDYSKNYFIRNTDQPKKYQQELKDFNSSEKGQLPKIFSTKAPFGKTIELIKANPGKKIGVICRTNKQIIDISKYLDGKNISYISTTTQGTAKDARNDLISFIKGILSGNLSEKVTAGFSVFSPFSMQEAFEFSNQADKKGVKTVPKLSSWKIAVDRDDLNKVFKDTILPVCISKGPEWFATAITVKEQIDEYFTIENPTFEGLFDFIAIGEESYLEQDQISDITLTTIHKAKGREFDMVIYIPSMTSPNTSFIDAISWAVFKALGIDLEDEVAEESLRMHFVAMTRAREKLFIIVENTFLGHFHIDKLSDFAVDAKEEQKLTVSSMNARLSEAYSLFVSGKVKESQKYLKQKETWIKDFILGYFRNVDHYYWSAIQSSPYEFLKRNIVKMPYGNQSTNFGLDVHKALQNILDGSAKESDFKDDILKSVKNGFSCLETIKNNNSGFKFVGSEVHVKVPMSDLTNYTKQDGFYFSGKIDAVFEHDNGIILVDWKTDKNKTYASEHKRQLAVYKKMYSKIHNISEDKIETCLIFVALRGSISTGKFDSEILYGHGPSVFTTFEGHVQKILAWRDKPNEFMKELVQEHVKTENQPLQGIIQDKLTSLGIK